MTEHITLRAAAERYLNDPTLSRSSKSQIVYRTTFATIVELLDGDVPVRSIGRSECRTLLNSLRNLPPNFRKRWPDRPALQAIELAEAQSVGGMSTANVNEYMSKLSSLFNWAVKEELADRNPARGLRLADMT